MTPLTGTGARGLLLPEAIVHSETFGVLAAFVAINTVMYVAFAIAKMLPKFYVSDFVNHRNRRRETRSIYPDAAP